MKGKDKPKKVQKKDKKIRPEAQGKVSEKYHVTPLDSSLISFSLSSSPSFDLCCPRRRIHEDYERCKHKQALAKDCYENMSSVPTSGFLVFMLESHACSFYTLSPAFLLLVSPAGSSLHHQLISQQKAKGRRKPDEAKEI